MTSASNKPNPLLLANDPDACLICDTSGAIQAWNETTGQWLQAAGMDTPIALLPQNQGALIQACQSQVRTITNVESRIGERSVLWTFIPDPENQHVVIRGRDATETLHELAEATRSNRLYRLIIENTTDLISRHAPGGHFVDASPASWRLLGFWPEELRGKGLMDVVVPESLEGQLDEARNSLRDSGYATLTLQIRRRDGQLRWFETAARAIRETYTGAVIEVVSVSRDITARVNSEENNRRLAQVVEANTDLVLFVSRTGDVSYMNPAARRALAVADNNPLPSVTAFFEPGEFQRLISVGLPQADRSGVWETETRLAALDGNSSLPVSLVLLSHQAAQGATYYSLVARDMTERELRESEQRRHQEELAHTARLATLGELASGIAHEMNQPLATIVNYANASKRYLGQLDDNPDALHRVQDGLQRITHHADHAAEVIKRLRAFLRKGKKRSACIALNETIDAAVRLCHWETAKHNITVELELAEANPTLTADPVLLQQVLINLIRNAVDANRERHHDAPSQIRITTRLSASQDVWIEVEDQGPGLDDEGLRQMFTPFFTLKSEGLGLGLSMSRSIVESFGGFLDAERSAEGGLRLICRFPAKAALGHSAT
ncbi:PAS domain-containing sensor histidine kinase [Marinobacter zhejiangensis]|uniref:histidine kinase n=1 Tax=Marinobacter zhejiangensis TaxID=488535 RepID=A0A1I4NG99_9GAMM|nr:PAS domain S-box protein [Marinobacter zhejiangensis]SFM14213.1 PAS domain S-box-containing protein [Marinobacter zhejiangensis]